MPEFKRLEKKKEFEPFGKKKESLLRERPWDRDFSFLEYDRPTLAPEEVQICVQKGLNLTKAIFAKKAYYDYMKKQEKK